MSNVQKHTSDGHSLDVHAQSGLDEALKPDCEHISHETLRNKSKTFRAIFKKLLSQRKQHIASRLRKFFEMDIKWTFLKCPNVNILCTLNNVRF